MERPIAILDRKNKDLQNKVVNLVKGQWQHRKHSKLMWETEDVMMEHYPDLFAAVDFKGKVWYKWGRFLTQVFQVFSIMAQFFKEQYEL